MSKIKRKVLKDIYEVKLNNFLYDQFPNMVVIPTIHLISKKCEYSFFILSLLIFLSKIKFYAFLDKLDVEIYKITALSASQSLTLEVTLEQSKSIQQPEEDKFICSPADISVHRKIDSQDVEVSELI